MVVESRKGSSQSLNNNNGPGQETVNSQNGSHRKIKGKKSTESKKDVKGGSSWSAFEVANIFCGVVTMVIVSYYHAHYMYQIHENTMWFSNIKEVEREISMRTEQGLYYSYYKQVVKSSSLWQGIKDLTQDKLTEYPDTINILERMNVYQEVCVAAIYRGFGIQMEPILFYHYFSFALNGVLVAALYLITWMLSGSWLAGLLSVSFFSFCGLDTTRVAYTAALREHFSLPFLWLQGAAITVFFQGTVSPLLQRVNQACLLLSTFLFCLFWQFNQFIMMLQGFALFGVWVLDLVPGSKVRSVIFCQQASLFMVCLLQFGNKMILGSLAVSFNFGFLAILLVFGDRFKPKTVLMHISRVTALSLLVLVIMVGLSSLIKVVLQVDSDEHIFKFLQNKFGVGDVRDFDSRVYLCLDIFQFIGHDIFIRLTKNIVFPFYAVSHLGMLTFIAYKVFKGWSNIEPVKGKNDQTAVSQMDCRPALCFHTVQCVFFFGLAVITERMKYLWTPYVCVLAAVGVADLAVWGRLGRWFGVKDTLKVSLVSNAAVVVLLGVVTATLLPPVLEKLEKLSEFYDPDTVELMEWIISKTHKGSSFTGSMQLLAGVKLCTGRPITNHPHYEDKYLRHKTKQLYQIYGKRTPEDVHAILTSYSSNYIILEDSMCRAPVSLSGCRMTDMVNIANGIKPDSYTGTITGLEDTSIPSFCDHIRHKDPAYTKYFRTVFVNNTFRIYKVL